MFEREEKIGLFALVAAIGINLSGLAVAVFLVGSLVASGVKAGTGQCGKTFGVPFVSQDWFCGK